MKQDNNNEIDLLLRSLGRDRRSESPLDAGSSARRFDEPLSDHLDADELNSFAEGVVPAPARARYVAHLADCGSCRSIVTNLAQATGAAAGSERLEHQTEAGFWQKLASLFAPPVLRYAVPALAIFAIIAISFIALRQQRRPDLVAQNERTDSASRVSIAQPRPEPSVAQSNTQAPAKIQDVAEPRPTPDASFDKRTLQGAKSGEDRVAETNDFAASSSSLKDAPTSKQGYVGGVTRPVFAPEPQAAPPPPPAKPALSEADKKVTVQKEEVTVTQRQVEALPVDEEKNQPRDEAGRHGPSRSNTAPGASRRADGLMRERAQPNAKSKRDSDDEVETRTVSGKHFRHQGSAWIDTAYDSSRRTINVSRGSEQFRALVSDEPGIRTIAEKLSGVVIVVWNGRAYRIQ